MRSTEAHAFLIKQYMGQTLAHISGIDSYARCSQLFLQNTTPAYYVALVHQMKSFFCPTLVPQPYYNRSINFVRIHKHGKGNDGDCMLLCYSAGGSTVE